MKKLSLFFNPLTLIFCLTVQSTIFAQFQFSGKIVDAESRLPIFASVVQDSISQEITLADENGFFSILTNGSLQISANGYIKRTIIIEEGSPSVITLRLQNTNLDEVLIIGSNIPQSQRLNIQSISVLDNAELRLFTSHDISQIINTIPGVFMQSGTLNTNRITIRGIGARNLFGTADIRAYFGDIPLTDGNGESAIEDLELESFSSISIIKGPSSSTYGVGLGGAIVFTPSFAKYGIINVKASQQFGSYGFNKTILNSQIGLRNTSLNITVSNTVSEGYRDNNQYSRKTITISSNINLSEDDALTFLGSFIDLRGGIPSSLSRNDYENNPQIASFTWARAKAYEDLSYGIFGLSWNHKFNSNYSLRSSANTSLRENYEPRPFNILDENVNSVSIRSRLLGKESLAGKSLDFTIGGEIFYDFYRNKTFENLYEDFSDGRGSVKGDQLSGFRERRNYINFFSEAVLEVSDKFRINTGINLNTTSFKVEDYFTDTPLENGGDFNFKSILSPKIGFTYQFDKRYILFANASHGFSTPTTAETLLPEGEFNPNLKPETGWNLESGLRYQLLDNKLFGSISLYNMLVKDLLVARRTQEDDFFAINAGKATLSGLELDMNYEVFSSRDYRLVFSTAISVHDYDFKEFVNLENDFSGNNIAGVPSSVLNFQFKLFSDYGFNGRLSYQRVGQMTVNDANSEFTDSYHLLNAYVGYGLKLFKSFDLEFHISGNNILDKRYVSQVQVNAIGFGDNPPRFYYPGLPFNYYSGLSLKYHF